MPKPVMVTTIYKGVFGGLVPDDQDYTAETMELTEARMALEWGTREIHALAVTGPGPKGRVSQPATVTLRGITAVWDIAPAAWAQWQLSPWSDDPDRREIMIAEAIAERAVR